ncbi:hypothetical protein MVEN_00669100 [Mycena venus]|uniref:G-protein coupled receptors family 2 profile 2 domain-containing protein n=1 Tax=Mycena venus TaxID=2733690 RepID=A0A8H6YQX1_9AGAR|nr:hypothetical protein MVEN_00669100 [Mycena venus]
MSLTLDLRSWSPDTQIKKRVTLALAIPGLGLTMVLLALCGYAAWNPVSRRYLDRVSFRLLIYTQIAHVVYCVVFILGPGTLTADPGWGCGLLAFTTDTILMFSAGMFFCMALNLPLVLVHKVKGQKMEKYYVLGNTLLCLICNIAAYASGHLGWDAIDNICWYRTNAGDLLSWLIGTQIVWIMLSAVGEVAAFLIIVGYLVAYELETRCFLYDADSQSKNKADSSATPRRPGSTIRMFRNIILRVGLYPLVSCLFNLSTTTLILYLISHPELTELNWRIDVAILALCAGRPLIYGLLAATDPSFIRALRALRHPENGSETLASTQSRDLWRSAQCLSTVIDMPPEEADHGADSEFKRNVRASIDLVCQL